MSGTTRVRFAPSPTGYFHVGGARTALFNWLFARRRGGSLVLRIEDTDEERNREEWVVGITSALSWLGVDWDEGPVRQSERREMYLGAAGRLRAEGRAYYCDCTRADVEARAGGRQGGPGATGYDRHCRDRGLEPGPGRALRFAVPEATTTELDDAVRGPVSFESDSVEDFVLVKSSGAPLFVLANVVDDIDMRITHVIRGEEHLPNTPKAVLLWHALAGPALPTFAHLPLLVNDRRQKLSKRRDRVAVEDFRDQGFLADAMRNYLVLLGWSPDDGREILSTQEMIDEFRLDAVKRAPAFFDVRKLTHTNGEYIRAMDTGAFVEACSPWLREAPWPKGAFDPAAFARVAPLVQERVSTLGEVPAMVDFLFLEDPAIDDGSWAKAVTGDPAAPAVLDAAIEAYEGSGWTAAELRLATEEAAAAVGRKLGRAQAPIRVAVSGRTVGPPLFESLEVLGRQRVLHRLRSARRRLAEP